MDKTQGDSNSITYEHAEQAVKNQAMATINTPDNENSDSSPVDPERLKDVFQDEVIKAFVQMTEFKRFAGSKHGLKLSDCDIKEICHDYRHSVEQNMGLLKKWKERMVKDATPENIREIVENYRKKLNEEESPRFTIGKQGYTVKVHGCVIIFPPDAVKETTEFQFGITFTTKHCPSGYIIITPTLICKPSMKFLTPVKVQLPTWFSTKSDKVFVAVMQKDDDKPEPETITEMKLNQISNNMVEFECVHFSDVWVTMPGSFCGEVNINISCSLYYDANGNFQFLLCVDNEEIIKKQENKLYKRGFKPSPLCLEPMKVRKGDEIKATLKCVDSDGVMFQPAEKTFKCTEQFAELKYSHSLSFRMTHLPSSEQLLDLQCALTGRNPQHNQQKNFNLKWFKTSGDTREAEVPNLAQREPQPRVPQELNQQQELANQEVNPEKLEDVFQDEVIKAFVSMAEFKKFARSKDGLKLKDCDVEEICQDNRQYVNEQKMGLLRKWKEKMGRDATPERIREIVKNYRKKLNKED